MEKYRQGVVCILINDEGLILIGENSKENGVWQFPQGGIEAGESAQQAFFRETEEELGNNKCEVIKVGSHTTAYRWPEPGYDGVVGQEQTWFLARFLPGEAPCLEKSDGCFLSLKWETPSQALRQIIDWKQPAFKQGLTMLGLI